MTDTTDETTPDDVLAALRAYHADTGHPVASAPDLAERLPVQRRRVHYLLELLQERGAVESRPLARGRGYWSVDTVTVSDPPAEPPAEPAGDTRADPPAFDVVDELDLPGSGPRLDDRRDAVRAVLQYLDANEQVRAGDLKTDVYPSHGAGYASADSWHTNLITPALRDLRDRDAVVLVDPHAGVYTLSE
jgi:hypothetical protein